MAVQTFNSSLAEVEDCKPEASVDYIVHPRLARPHSKNLIYYYYYYC